jgi:hypothetical protein
MTDSPIGWARHLPDEQLREMLLEVSTAAGRAFGGDPQTQLGELESTLRTWRFLSEPDTSPLAPYDLEVPPYPRTDAEFAALPVLNLNDFHAQEGK